MKNLQCIEKLIGGHRILKCTVAVALLPLLPIACGAKKADDAPSSMHKESSQLSGTWQSDCRAGSFLSSTYLQKKMKFNMVGGFRRETILFDNAKCEGPKTSTVLNGTYDVVGDAPNEPDAKQLNLTAKNSFVTPLTDAAAGDFNKSKYCGISDWKTNIERGVSGVNCESGFKEGQVIFDIYRIQENHIYFGSNGLWLNGGSDNQRPKKLDLNDPHARQ